jgi:hypothetical protein
VVGRDPPTFHLLLWVKFHPFGTLLGQRKCGVEDCREGWVFVVGIIQHHVEWQMNISDLRGIFKIFKQV